MYLAYACIIWKGFESLPFDICAKLCGFQVQDTIASCKICKMHLWTAQGVTHVKSYVTMCVNFILHSYACIFQMTDICWWGMGLIWPLESGGDFFRSSKVPLWCKYTKTLYSKRMPFLFTDGMMILCTVITIPSTSRRRLNSKMTRSLTKCSRASYRVIKVKRVSRIF